MKFNKQQWGWIFYDWANSGYGILVTTAVLPVYFKAIAADAGVSAANSTAYWGYANSVGTLIVSILAPLLGTLADYPRMKRRWLNVFTWAGIVMTFCLALVLSQHWILLLAVYILASIGYSGGNLFYDSFLTDIAANDEMDRVSSTGYSMGYLGGVIAFIIFLVPELTNGFGGKMSSYAIAKFSFIVAAVWWVIFGWPLLRHGQQKYSMAAVDHPLSDSFSRLKKTVTHLRKYRRACWFLVAYFFYIDGVDTIFTMATSIGRDLGVKTGMLMVVLLAVQLIAVPFSLLYGWAADKIGTRRALIIGICVYIVICLYALRLKTLFDFWFLAILIGTSQGGIQALSRSYFGRLIPKNSSNELFGFYNILGKFSAIIVPVLFGVVSQLTGKSTLGACSLSILFIVCLLVFISVSRLTGGSSDQD